MTPSNDPQPDPVSTRSDRQPWYTPRLMVVPIHLLTEGTPGATGDAGNSATSHNVIS